MIRRLVQRVSQGTQVVTLYYKSQRKVYDFSEERSRKTLHKTETFSENLMIKANPFCKSDDKTEIVLKKKLDKVVIYCNWSKWKKIDNNLMKVEYDGNFYAKDRYMLTYEEVNIWIINNN